MTTSAEEKKKNAVAYGDDMCSSYVNVYIYTVTFVLQLSSCR
jgi:hypothetical protein